jgi:phospholipase DDHD1
MNYPGRGAPRSPERNGRGGGAWELGSDAAGVFGGGGCCFEHQPGDSVPLSLLRAEPLHLAPGADDLSHLALDPCLSDETYDFSSAESGSSLRYYSEGESAGGGSSSSPPPPLVAQNSGGGGAAGGGPGDRKRARPGGAAARHRYEVVTELGPEEVRWFYKEDKKTWKPFIGYDSLRIELAFRTLLQTTGAQARAAGRDGDRVCGPSSSFGEEDEEDSACGFCPRAAGPEPEMEELVTIEPVCVRGGLYEVDVTQGECYPVYWNRKWLARGGPGSARAGRRLGVRLPPRCLPRVRMQVARGASAGEG